MNTNNARVFTHASGLQPGEQPQPLHTTLPLEDLIELFAAEIGELVAYDSFEYENRRNSIHVFIGTHALHKCNYRINIGTLEFGQLALTRKSPFLDAEMNLLEGALGALIIHLNNIQDGLREGGMTNLCTDPQQTSMS